MHEDIEVVARVASVLSEQAGLISFSDGQLHVGGFVVELAADVNVSSASTHGTTSDQAALDELMWIVSHDFSVLAGSRFALVGVDDEILWTTVGGLVHERPFHARWETSSTATTETRSFDLVDDPCIALLENFLCLMPVTALHRALQAPVVASIKIREDAILVWECTESCSGLWWRCVDLSRVASDLNILHQWRQHSS